jgi:hypothetical protein
VLDNNGEDDMGHWTKHALSIFDLKSRSLRVLKDTLDAGDARFCADGRHLLWLTRTNGPLILADSVTPSVRRVLAKSVRCFAVRR